MKRYSVFLLLLASLAIIQSVTAEPLLATTCTSPGPGPTKSVPIIAGKFWDTGPDPFRVEDLQAALFPGLTNYFSEVSYGQLQLTGTVYGTVTGGLIEAPNMHQYYEGNQASAGPPPVLPCNGSKSACGARTDEYVRTLLAHVDGRFDWGQYDSDHNNVVDCVVIVFPTRDNNSATSPTDPATNSMRSSLQKLSDYPSGPYITSNGYVIDKFTLCPLLSGYKEEARITEIGIYAHELGHCLGLHDLSYNGSPASWCCNLRGSLEAGVGYWDLMGWGGLGVIGIPNEMPKFMHPSWPTHMSARSKEALGWLDPEVITHSQINIRLDPIETAPQAIKVFPWGATTGNEYFLIEYRRPVPTSFDRELPGSGLLIWRVTRASECFCPDGSLLCQQGPGVDIGLELIEANYLISLQSASQYGDEEDLFPGPQSDITQVSDDPDFNVCYRKLRTKADEPTGLKIYNIVLHDGGAYATFDLEIRTPDVAFSPVFFSPDDGLRGVSWGDVDGDGHVDMYLTREPGTGSSPKSNQLLLGSGTSFSSISIPTLLADTNNDHWSAPWADIDNDGDLDIGIANLAPSPSLILRNNGCSSPSCAFVNVLPTAPTGAYRVFTWNDYNRDGRVDALLLGSAPTALKNGARNFTEETIPGLAAGLDINEAVWGDYDGDHLQDLLVMGRNTNISPAPQQVALYRNLGDGTFQDQTSNAFGSTFPFYAAVWFDFDNDGDLDLCGGVYNAPDVLLDNRGTGAIPRFVSLSDNITGIAHAGHTVSMVALDYDNDGNSDLYIADAFASGCGAENSLYHNTGQRLSAPYFRNVTSAALREASCTSLATADIDNDGYVDIAVSKGAGSVVFRNGFQPYSSNHWFQVQLIGRGVGYSNSSGIGARVEVTAGTTTQIREVTGGRGRSQDSFVACFGLGSNSTVSTLKVYWPSPGGLTSEIHNLSADRLLTINEPFRGTISQNTTWSGTRVLDGDVVIAAGATLTVLPGTQILVSRTDAGNLSPGTVGQVELIVNGTLQMPGGPSLVSFRSSDPATTTFSWGGIIMNGGTALIQDAEIRDARNGISSLAGGTWTVDDCHFRSNLDRDINITGTNPSITIENTTFDVTGAYGVGTAIDVSASSAATITILDNTITGTNASTSGIRIANGGDPTLDGNLVTGFSSMTTDRGIGIHVVSGTPLIVGNDIRSSKTGIRVDGGQPTIGITNNGNQMSANTTGLFVQCIGGGGNCPNSCSVSATLSYNSIINNTDGVVAYRTVSVDLGHIGHPGRNDIYGNTRSIWNQNPTNCGEIQAEGNYWGANCIMPGTCPAAPTSPSGNCKTGSVDVSSPRCVPSASCPKCLPPAMPTPGQQPGPVVNTTPAPTALVDIHPNPFNPTTTISYDLRHSVSTEISIYNVSGQLVRKADLGSPTVGRNSWVWDGRDQRGSSVSSGVYFVVLKAGNVTDRKKAVLLK